MWIYQAVTNVGIQVLVLMGLGYIFARFKFLEQAKFLPQSNFLVLMLALPAFNLYLMGIKLDLQNPEPWKSLAAFLVWVFLTQSAILVYTWRFCAGDAGEAAVINMVLLMDNYAITGLLALNATLGTKWGTLALLMAMGFFLVIFPFSLAAFEWEKWAVKQHVEAIAEAAALDIEAATVAAAEAEAAAEGKALGSTADQPPPTPPSPPHDFGGGGGGALMPAPVPLALTKEVQGGRDLSRYLTGSALPSADVRQLEPPPLPLPPLPPPPSKGQTMINGDEFQKGANGFPHESRYCWWSNEDYRPAHPLLPSDTVPSTSQPSGVQRASMRQQWQQRRRRQQELGLEQLRQQQQQQQQQKIFQTQQAGSYVPPLPLPAPSTGCTTPHEQAPSLSPLVSPFQAPAGLGWQLEGMVGAATTSPNAANITGEGPPALSPPGVASLTTGGIRRPATASSLPSAAQSPWHRQVERRGPSLLVSVFDRLAAAGSGQIPAPLLGDLGRAGGGLLAGNPSPPQPERPRLQDLEFALTHQLSGGTANQLARLSRGYTAAAAAASAAATSPNADVRRLLLHSAGRPARSPLQIASATPRPGTAEPVRLTPSPATPCIGPSMMSRSGPQLPPPSPSTRAGLSASLGLSPPEALVTAVGGGAAVVPVATALALASLESGDSIGPPLAPIDDVPLSGSGGKSKANSDEEEAAAAAKYAELACPTISRQGAVSAAVPSSLSASIQQQPAAARPAAMTTMTAVGTSKADGDGRLATMSMPMFSFGHRPSQQRMVSAATGGGEGGGEGGGSLPAAAGGVMGRYSEFDPSHRGGQGVQRSASDTGQVDRMLLKFASGLALDSARRRATASIQRRSQGLLMDADPAVLLQLANAVSAQDIADLSAASAADKQLVREATKEVLRRHGGLARAFAAFVSGHPQLWHIICTLAKNPMIWTMFVAMTVSVSGLRVFLDPASHRYRPEVGWVAGSLSWINGLVVPISIFSNGAWMYGKPLLPKGEVVKMLVLLFIKVGLLPLLMAGCALLVQLDGQHVAAMTVLTLSPAAAASFVLAVQYGRGVELVSLTNILGNIFLTPLLIMWLKILAALHVNFRLHDDG